MDKNSEEYRRYCEARYVLKKPLNERRKYLADIERIRGKKARDYLAAEVTRLFYLNKACVNK